MWYVNVIIGIELTSFISSFILTMWYVNKNQDNIRRKYTPSFILTMWYVNAEILAIKQYMMQVLY